MIAGQFPHSLPTPFARCFTAMAVKQHDDIKLEKREQEEVYQKSAASARVVYKAVELEGEDELSRSTSALAWSGLAAGLSMGSSS
jgi:hypothetical protein